MTEPTINTLLGLSTALTRTSNFEECVDLVKSLGLIAKFEPRGPTSSPRLLITHDRFGEFDCPLSFQANGAVYDTAAKRFVCIPSPGFNCKAKYEDMIPNLDKYTVYVVQDGTMVNLYWYDDKWTIGTTHGYDLNDYKWMGPNTYETELKNALKLYPEFSFDRLDKALSYNLGFRTHSFHPVKTDPPCAWFVSAYHSETLTMTDVDIGIPRQTTLDLPAGTPKERFDWLLGKSNAALKKYINGRTVHDYGWILRSGDYMNTRAASHAMIESSLLRKVRQLAYNMPKSPRVALDETNRFEYMTMRAWVTYQLRDAFVGMFPEVRPRYDVYAKTVNDIIDRMVRCYRNRNLHEKLVSSSRKGQTLSADTLAYTFMADIDKKNKMTPSPQMHNIIYNFIVDVRYLDLYFQLLSIPAHKDDPLTKN